MRFGPYIPPQMPDHWAQVARLDWGARSLARATWLLALAFLAAHAAWGPSVRPWYAGSAVAWIVFVSTVDHAARAYRRHAEFLDDLRRRP